LLRNEKIIGATSKANAIHGSGAFGGVFFDIDLSTNRVSINNIPGLGSETYVVENFVNVTGTSSNDAINGSSGMGGTSFDVDLSVKRLTLNDVPGIGSATFVVENFVNVTGTVGFRFKAGQKRRRRSAPSSFLSRLKLVPGTVKNDSIGA
jgi:hypothetical protein